MEKVFSGIIETVGAVRSLRKDADGARIAIEAPAVLDGVRLGDSIALNGVCVTVVDFDERKFEADLSIETLRRTNLGELAVGGRCNLERAMALGERLGGHLVSGHVDGVGKIRSRKNEGDSIWLTFEAPVEVMRYVVYKGSIAVDGISLTVAACDSKTFSVSIIPHTSEQTTLTEKKDGAAVNLEADLIGKYVEKLLAPHAESRSHDGVTMEKLREQGYA
ncbi:MAG: riboflavin synthase [Nitrospinae bacterium]|nr:riboflavin synthase [Nitrospinota bacterium]